MQKTVDSIFLKNDEGKFAYYTTTGKCLNLENNKEFSVTFQLQGNDKPQAKGIVIGQAEKWSGMVMEKYSQLDAIGIADEVGNYSRVKVQYNRIEGGIWPGDEVDVIYSRYIQVGLQAVKGSSLHIETMGMFIGGGAKYRVVCSKNEDFTDTYTLGEYTIDDAKMRKQLWQVDQQLNSGEKLFIRIYPWCTEKTADCWLCLYDIIIKGHSKLE